MTRTLTLVAALFTMTALSACETVHGAGQDIQHAGDGISHAAKDTQAQM